MACTYYARLVGECRDRWLLPISALVLLDTRGSRMRQVAVAPVARHSVRRPWRWREFDKMFLQMMISHHQGAVQAATTEIQQGQNRAAKSLAEKVKTDQTAEIAQMQNLLKGK